MAELRPALARRKKAELVDVLRERAPADRGVLRQLSARFDVAAPADELAAATRQAIADATDFDKRDINRTFDYDYAAYGEVKRNVGRLLAAGQLRPAMQLALELMKQGSDQVDMSDEGLMTEDIEDCLSVVLTALSKCDLPADEVIAWCTAMLDSDRVGFITREPLPSLRNRIPAAAARAPDTESHRLAPRLTQFSIRPDHAPRLPPPFGTAPGIGGSMSCSLPGRTQLSG